MKKKVICDTNIWYDLVEGRTFLDKNKFEYYATGTNIGDLIVSDKIYGSPDDVQLLKNAIKSIEQYSDGFIFIDPYTYAAVNLIDESPDTNEIQQYKDAYFNLLSYANNEIQGIYGPGITALRNTKLDFQTQTLEARKQFDQLALEKQLKLDQMDSIIERNIADWLLLQLNTLFDKKFSHNEINNWDSVLLFIKTYKKFLKDMNPQQNPQSNSMIDLLQLLYIDLNRPMLFWTMENKINNKIRDQFKDNTKYILYKDYLDSL